MWGRRHDRELHRDALPRARVVLIADPDPTTRARACRSLGRDYMVQSAGECEEAVRLAAGARPDALVVSGVLWNAPQGWKQVWGRHPIVRRIPTVVWGADAADPDGGTGEPADEATAPLWLVIDSHFFEARLRDAVTAVLARRAATLSAQAQLESVLLSTVSL